MDDYTAEYEVQISVQKDEEFDILNEEHSNYSKIRNSQGQIGFIPNNFITKVVDTEASGAEVAGTEIAGTEAYGAASAGAEVAGTVASGSEAAGAVAAGVVAAGAGNKSGRCLVL